MNQYTAAYTDQYQLTMAEVYFLENRHEHKAVFDYFFRKAPFNGSYALFTGLENLLDILENLSFTQGDIDFLHKQKLHPDFLDYLKNFRFRGTVRSMKEGEVVFPAEPILSLEANIAEAQIIETLLLNILNYQTLIATKASRMRSVAKESLLIDFGMRRAQSVGAYFGARSAFIGGFDATSNVTAGKDFAIPVSGTMAHSFIQSYDDELEAFRHFAENRPHDCVLLVDTYDTLKSGLPNAIKVGKEMESSGEKLKGIRLDSGDLAYLSRKARKMLDDAGLDYVKIAASNQLDEYLIKSLNDQKAQIDVYGVGTSLMTGQPDAALDGVFKLASYDNEPRIKLSDSAAKISLPDKKQVFRLLDNKGMFFGADVITLHDEEKTHTMHHPFEALKKMKIGDCPAEKLLKTVMKDGKRKQPKHNTEETARYARERLAQLPEEHKRFEYPHIYKVGLSDKLNDERNRLIETHKAEN